MRSCVSNLQARKSVVASGHPSVDGVLRLENGATVFLPNASLSQKVATWLAVETHAKPSFEIPGANFVASGVELTDEGRKNVAQLAQILSADPNLSATIVFSDRPEMDDGLRQLGQSRGSRLRAELIQEHVPPSKIASSTDS